MMSIRESLNEEAYLSPKNDEQHLWSSFAESKSRKARERIFTKYLPLARRLAGKYASLEIRISIEYGDLFQLACTGLLESIDRFKSELGVPFRYFANRRINGAIVNGIAKYSELSQQISVQRRVAKERMHSLKDGTGNPSSLDDALAALGNIAAGLALGLILEESAKGSADLADNMPGAFETVAWKQMVKLVRDSIEQLPAREKDIMIWHYIEGLTFEHISALLGLTKGRISQVHKAAIALLRKRLLNSSHLRFEG